MKTKLKRHSRSALSVLLTICMLISCMTVGLIATDAAKVASDSEVGWNSSTDYFHYQVNNGGWSKAYFSTGGKATFTVDNNSTTLEFELNFNGTIYKYDSSQAGFTAAGIRSSSGTTRLAKTSGNSTYKVTGVYADTYTVQLNGTPNNGEQSFTISGNYTGTCSTDQTYIVIGEKHLTNTDTWQNTVSGATSRNIMVYDTEAKMYKLEYNNIAASTSGFKFRITTPGNWDSDKGYPRSNLVDSENIATTVKSSDNNSIKMTLSQAANITIYFDDSKTDTSSITLIVTPAVSTVTAAVSPAGSGTAKVNGGASASNIAYSDSVNLSAEPGANYHFKNWSSTNGKLTFTNVNSATTTATVFGTDTATAVFEADTFSILKAGGDFTMTAPNTAQYNSSVSVSATAASGYTVESIWYSTDGGTTKTTIASAASGSFTMPASDVTVGAIVEELGSGTITFGVNNASYGYVSVGKQHGSTQNQIEESYTSPKADVIQGTKVNFCAIPAKGYKFVGWYTDSGCTASATGSYGITAAQQTTKDITVTMPNSAVTLYAKFADAPDTVTPDPLLDSTKVTLFIKSSNKDVYIHTWNGGDIGTSWPGTNSGTYVTIGGQQYLQKQTTKTSFSLQLNLGNNSNQSNDYSFSGSLGKGYYLTYNGNNQNVTKSSYTAQTTTTADPDKQTTDVYPVFLEVTNPEYDSSHAGTSTYAPAYATKSTAFTVNHTPDSDHKATLTTVGYTGSTTGTNSSNRTMTSTYSSSNKVTVTYAEYEYYPVTFSAGPNGTVTATAGGNTITSGTKVKEGTKVVFTASPNANYSFDSWESGSSGSGGSTTRTVPSLSGAANAKAYFKYNNDGEKIDAGAEIPYFRYGTSNNTSSNWNAHRIKVKNGHAYGYIDNPGTSNTYYFSVSDNSNDTANCFWTYKKGTCVTDFPQYVDVGTSNIFSDNNFMLGTAKAKSGVSRLIIILGEWTGTKFQLEYDTFRVIPVYDTDATNVDIYAKDGSYRGSTEHDFFPNIADTVLTGASNIEHQTYFDTGSASRGDTITVTTTINSANKGKYYVKGFSFNGVTPELYSYKSNGEYSCTYKIPDDFAYDYLEITPIYYIKDADAVEFYIENYDETFQATGWGNTLSVYPYYFVSGKSDVKTSDNVFGGYPGQPVINYGGRRFIQIPTSYTMDRRDRAGNDSNYPPLNSTAIIKGMTLSNDYWDIVHREYVNEVDTHLQTYDYDDFYKIYRETTDGKEINGKTKDGQPYSAQSNNGTADQITFAFKYRTSKDNFGTDRYSNNNTMPATITKSDFSNGWDEYLDYHDRPIDVFGKILTTEEQAKDPLLIVSNGYEYTHAGYYATLWTIYSPDGQTKIGTISPSALEINPNSTPSRLTNTSIYPNSLGRTDVPNTVVMKQLSDFETVYNDLKNNYSGVPALITYEKQLSNDTGQSYYTDWGERSNRSDGRWYYSYMNEKINASLRIEYSNDNGATYTVDSYKSGTNKGSVTGATVQFTNKSTDTDGPYELEGLKDTKDYNGDIHSNLNHYYKFAATSAPGYVFAGWWFERDGIVTNVNEDLGKLDGKSQMTSNAIFVARYVKAPTGTLTINHTLAENSVGTATTYVSVKAINKSTGEETLLTGTTANPFVEDTYSIGSEYISYKSGYRFEVKIKTEITDQFARFDRFSAGSGSEDFFAGTVSGTDTPMIKTMSVDVDNLFEIGTSGFPEQTKDVLDYFSHLKSATYNYALTYSYDPYVSAYGRQTYSVNGTYTYDELHEYMTITTPGNVLTFVSADKKTAFLNKMGPLENNFMQENTWKTTGEDEAVEYFSGNTLTITINENRSLKDNVKVYLNLPYSHQGYSNKYAPNEESSDGNKVYRSESYLDSTVPAQKYNYVLSFNSIHYVNPDKTRPQPDFLTAPEVIYSGNDHTTAEYFRYWIVKTNENYSHGSSEYTRCYSREFNYVLFTDIVIEPYYSPLAEGEAIPTPNSEQAKGNVDNGINISFIENSRNQYNNNGCGDGVSSDTSSEAYMSNTRRVAGDRIYSDFLLSFNNIISNNKNEPMQLNDFAEGTYKTGLIVETVGDIKKVNGKYQTETDTAYQTQYGSTLTEISTKLSGKDEQGQDITVNREDDLKSFIRSGSSAQGNFLLSEFDAKKLDNKNRIRYFYTLPNRRHNAELTDDLTRRYKVYRAYAYIRNSDNSVLEISQKPVYFTIYDIGSIQNASEAISGGGYKS